MVCHEQDHWQKKCTILFHGNDLKTSHVESAVVSRVIADIDTEYGNIAKINITRGKVHKYLRMSIDYSSPGKLMFSMIDYIVKKYWQYSRRHEGVIRDTCCTPPLWHCRRCNQNIPSQCRPLPPFCSITTISFKYITSRHPDSSILPMH